MAKSIDFNEVGSDYLQRLQGRAKALFPYAMAFPLVGYVVVFQVIPTIVTFVQSFFIVNPLSNRQGDFAGLHNYRRILQSHSIMVSWGNEFLYVVFGLGMTMTLGLLFAIQLNRKSLWRPVLLAILVLPWALPGVIEGVIWSWIYNPRFGVLNYLLVALHISRHYHTLLATHRILSVFLIELVQAWQLTPLTTLLILGGLGTIPVELNDATAVDGATSFQGFRYITLPLLRPALIVASVQIVIQSLNIFDQVYVLNGNATLASSVMLQTYLKTFQNLNFGEGYALSFMVTAVTLAISALLFRFSSKDRSV